ncbi:transcriptional regulator [Stenotrophomonas rhizophila]|nr:sigma factor-like helix-turn-helix DNA-binding protein [Stenotrophomonas rhizophila]MCC7633637.1 transcriptional regulator [Stenotrophomonas rhizophila]MCC7663583.1 transcriptional regulator [Stenotrophomonas rhizophila]
MDPTHDRRCALPPASERVWHAFLAALDQLPPDVRAVLLLHDVLGAGLDDIAPLLGMDLPACRQCLQQARTCLRANGDALAPGAS